MPNNILDDIKHLEAEVEYPKLSMDFSKAPQSILDLKKVFLGIAFIELCLTFMIMFKPHLSKASLGEGIFIIILLIFICPATAAIGYLINLIAGSIIEFLRQLLFLGIGKLVVERSKNATKILSYQKKFMKNYSDLIVGLLSFAVALFILIEIALE